MSPLLSFNIPGVVRIDQIPSATCADLMHAVHSLHAHPLATETQGILIVLPDVPTAECHDGHMRQLTLHLVESQRRTGWTRCALATVEPSNLMLARMVEGFAARFPFQIRAFHCEVLAMDWIRQHVARARVEA